MPLITNLLSFRMARPATEDTHHSSHNRSMSESEAHADMRGPADSLTRKDELERENHYLQRVLGRLVAERNDLSNKVTQLEKSGEREVAEKETHKKMLEYKNRVLFLKERNSTLDNENKHLRGRLESTMSELRKVQLSIFKQSRTGWFIEEDSNVREALTRFYKDVRAWAKSCCITSFTELEGMTDEALKSLTGAINRVAVFSSDNSVYDFKNPFLVLSGLLSDHLNYYIFLNQFYYFHDHDGVDTAASLADIYERLRKTNHSEANIWRAQLFRSIFPKPGSPGLEIGREFSVDRIKNFSTFVTKGFFHGAASKLLRQMKQDEDKQCLSELHHLVQRAIKLHSRVQTQRAQFVWKSIPEILGQEFDVRSSTMAADRLHKLDDDEDESCDGKLVQVVISPSVEVFGDSNGENFDSSRVIAKAMVYLQT